MADKTQESLTSQGVYNANYLQDSSFMMMRLNTAPLLWNLRKAIGAKAVMLVQDPKAANGFREVEMTIGKARANDEGVMQICNIVEEIVNQHMAQGNLKEDDYWNFVSSTRVEITETILKKCYDWDVSDSHIESMINEIMRMMKLFLTRPIDDKERLSYGQQFQTKEMLVTNPKAINGGLTNFGNAIGKK